MLICEHKKAERGKWVRLRSGKRDAGRRVKDEKRMREKRKIRKASEGERRTQSSTFTPANMT